MIVSKGPVPLNSPKNQFQRIGIGPGRYCNGSVTGLLTLPFTVIVRFTAVAEGKALVIVIFTMVIPTIPAAAVAESGCTCTVPAIIVIGSTAVYVFVAEGGKPSGIGVLNGPNPVP